MDISSKGGPRISVVLRFVLATFALFFLLPVIFALGAYGWIPNFEVTNFSWSALFLTVTVLFTLVAAWLLYVAASGRNPFHRLDVIVAELAEEWQRLKR